MRPLFISITNRLVLLAFVLASLPVFAGGHGGGATSGLPPLQFTVNLSTTQFLQVVMEFEFADPEVAQHLADLKPKVLHKIILLLSDLDVAALQTSKGKVELQERVVNELNGLLRETPKTGVREVFFTSFIVQ
ncbi:MAG: flagellar basal body-associated FliL family protein [Betaproteobacteria bacterium]|nr:flagellar basal body-associated FliL family protein [Betaproteobacteria bacterium]